MAYRKAMWEDSPSPDPSRKREGSWAYASWQISSTFMSV